MAERDRGGIGRAQRLAAVVPADGLDDGRGGAGAGGQGGACGGVVDAEARALVEGAHGAARMLAGDGVDLVLAEGQRQDELAEVVEEARQVAVAGHAAAGLGDGAARRGHRQGVQVHLAAHDGAVAGHRLEEAVGAGLQGELADAQPADHDDRLAHALRL